jgi:hypothetical protein
MVKRLMAENQVHAGIGDIERRDIAITEFNRDGFLQHLHLGALQTFFFSIDADHPLRREMFNQRAKRITLPASRIEHRWVAWFTFRHQSRQIVERNF